YWEKDIWIIPIHRPLLVGHWVSCIAHLSTKQLHLFDSLGDRREWKADVKVSGLSCTRQPLKDSIGYYDTNNKAASHSQSTP
ncbi:hypothetical protein SERLA73DRAFT_44847, partial [Serpula lacrymans var. lacrymans S7.3]